MAREKPGWAQRDPEISARIRQRVRQSPGLEKAVDIPVGKVVDISIVRRAYVAAHLYLPQEGSADYEAKRRLSAIKDTGWHVESYDHLKGWSLRGYLARVQRELAREAIRADPSIVEDTNRENAERIRGTYHY